MAKPIRATPELKDSEAKKFIKEMESREKEKITERDIHLARAIKTVIPLIC